MRRWGAPMADLFNPMRMTGPIQDLSAQPHERSSSSRNSRLATERSPPSG